MLPTPRSPHLVAPAALALLLALAATLGLGAGPAGAGTATTNNACLYSADNYWRNLEITLTGDGAPNPAPPGTPVTSTVRLEGAMPEWIPQYGYNYGFLQAGENRIPLTMWLAVEGTGSAEGVQVAQVQVEALTTVTDPDGVPNSNDETGTAPRVDVTLPAQTWTSTGGPIELRQAGAGTLPTLPGAGARGGDATPEGSLFIGAQLGSRLFTLDCQPGQQTERGESFAPGTATAFATVAPGAAGSPTTTAAGTATSTPPTTSAPATTAPAQAASGDGGGSSALPVILAVVAVVVVGGGATWFALSRRSAGGAS